MAMATVTSCDMKKAEQCLQEAVDHGFSDALETLELIKAQKEE